MKIEGMRYNKSRSPKYTEEQLKYLKKIFSKSNSILLSNKAKTSILNDKFPNNPITINSMKNMMHKLGYLRGKLKGRNPDSNSPQNKVRRFLVARSLLSAIQ